jgi:hypothetical protein
MADFKEDEFKFPDEDSRVNKVEVEVDAEPDLQIEIEDDTPVEDRGRTPADPAKVKALEVEVDDLDKYSKDAKDKLIKMKRVWNDERRAKEAADRERNAALEAAQRLQAQNQELQKILNSGKKEYKEALKDQAKMQLKMAKKAYKDAYESGDTDAILEAQEAISQATLKVDKVKNFKLPPLQQEQFVVQPTQQVQNVPRPDDKVMDWQSKNPWFGQDEEMTAAALGLHEKLKRQGVHIGSDDYYAKLDNTMRKRFPENFDEDLDTEEVEEVPAKRKADTPKTKPATVVASATRTTAPKRVRLTTSQVAIAKKLGLSPEQYVRELLKMEA